MIMRLVHRVMSVYFTFIRPVPNYYDAWRWKHYMNSLLKVTLRQYLAERLTRTRCSMTEPSCLLVVPYSKFLATSLTVKLIFALTQCQCHSMVTIRLLNHTLRVQLQAYRFDSYTGHSPVGPTGIAHSKIARVARVVFVLYVVGRAY